MAKQKVLIAEDVKLISQPLVWALEAEGFETKVARDGASCLDLARTFLPDILDPIRKAFRADGFRFSATGGPAYGWQASGFRLPTLPMSRY